MLPQDLQSYFEEAEQSFYNVAYEVPPDTMHLFDNDVNTALKLLAEAAESARRAYIKLYISQKVVDGADNSRPTLGPESLVGNCE